MTGWMLVGLLLFGIGFAGAIIPGTQFGPTAQRASVALGDSRPATTFSPLIALRGLPVDEVVHERTIAYRAADGSPLAMRLFTGAAGGARPTVVVIYGGGWRFGEPSQSANVSRALAARGYTVAAIDYRHAPRARFPAQIDDVRLSLAMLRDSAAAWAIDPSRIALLGRSSGGHLAELAAFSPGAVPVRAVIAIYAPYDLVAGYRDLPNPDPIGVPAVLRDLLGGSPDARPEQYHAASPSSFVRAGLPPTLLIYGSRDHIVKAAFNRRAAAELRAAHVPTVEVEIPWAEHGFDMVPGGLGAQIAFTTTVRFLDRWIGAARGR